MFGMELILDSNYCQQIVFLPQNGLIPHKNAFMLAQILDSQILIPERTPGHALNSIYSAGAEKAHIQQLDKCF